MTTATETIDEHHFEAIVVSGDGVRRAVARCAVNVKTRCGAYGEMRILDDEGAPRQRIRALVLLTRAALQRAQELGIVHVTTEAPDRLVDFARTISGLTGAPADGRALFAGDLSQIRTHALETTDADGNVRG